MHCLDLYQSKKKTVAFGRTFDEEEYENEKQAKKGKKKGKKKQTKIEKINVRSTVESCKLSVSVLCYENRNRKGGVFWNPSNLLLAC